MRCLIYAKSEDISWLNEYFPDMDPYLLKIVNKPLLEYAMDFVSLLRVKEIRIVSDASTKGIESFFGDGAKWGVNTSYALAHPGDTISSVYLKNSSFCKEQDLLIWNGFFFLQYDRNQITCAPEFRNKFYTQNKRFVFLPRTYKLSDLKSEDLLESSPCFVTCNINNIADYYTLSMAILTSHNKKYVLPGYSSEQDTFLGLNISYPQSAELHPPIMIGDKSRFRKNTLIGPNSIIGNNVIVDDNSSVIDSIIYDNTYIGRDLDLDHKIVYKGNLIDAYTEEVLHVEDKVLVSEVEPGLVTTYLNRSVQRICAFALCIIQFPFWLLLFLPFIMLQKNTRTERLLTKNMNTAFFTDADLLRKTFWGRIMLRLSLDKFEQFLAAAISRNIYLVGNRLLTNTVIHRNLVMNLPVYNPGAFSLAESVETYDIEAEMFYELEYIDWISTHYNIKILVRSLFRRLFFGYTAFEKPHK